MNDFLKKNTYCSALLINTFFFAFSILFLTPYFMSNDDPLMMMMASGTGAFMEPSPNLFFIHYLLGELLVFLYTTFGSLEWYMFFFYCILFLSYNRILVSFIKLYHARGYAIYTLFFAITLILPITTGMHYTVIASILTSTGILILLSSSQLTRLEAFLSVFYILLGSLIRFNPALLTLLLSLPIWFWKVQMKGIRSLSFPFLIVASSLVFVFTFHSLRKNYYKHHDHDYFAFNQYRTQLVDYNILERISEERREHILNQVGWSINDYNLLNTWFFFNDSIYSLDRFKLASELFSASQTLKLEHFRAIVIPSLKVIISPHLILLVFFLLFFFKFSYSNLLKITSAILWLVAVGILVSYLFKVVPYWVILGMYISTLISLVSILDLKPNLQIRFNKRYLAIYGIVLTVIFSQRIHLIRQVDKSNRKVLPSIVALKKHLPHQSLLVVWAGGFPFELVPANQYELLHGFDMVFLGTMQQSKDTKKQLTKHHISNLELAICKKSNVYLSIEKKEATSYLGMYKQYMLEHYGLDKASFSQDTIFSFEGKNTDYLVLKLRYAE